MCTSTGAVIQCLSNLIFSGAVNNIQNKDMNLLVRACDCWNKGSRNGICISVDSFCPSSLNSNGTLNFTGFNWDRQPLGQTAWNIWLIICKIHKHANERILDDYKKIRIYIGTLVV